MKPPVKTLRCALYTRKSSEEGLDQAFNSLHAQREACEAYVKSQASEGWKALPAEYDDGGFSGGSMERPALRRLLADIAAGRIDVIVVYKIDRLTRSLMDFARIVELFDKHAVSFVSVTQAFNTTTSMGRLTLNVLLSFAQFEREVTGERIRDKIAASKAKGMWMGGLPPLGYDRPTDPTTRALVVNETEAQTVRLIFDKYLELGSVHAVADWLEAQDIRSKAMTSAKGNTFGDLPFSRGALFHLLRNKIYLGLIVHKDQTFPGAHPGIVDQAVFEAVQVKLDVGATRHRERPKRVVEAPLRGRVFDADGFPMSPSFAHGSRGQVYRYYVSSPLQLGRSHLVSEEAIHRVPGPALDAKVGEIMARLAPSGEKSDPLARLDRVEIHPQSLQMMLPIGLLASVRSRLDEGEEAAPDPARPDHLRLVLPIRMRLRGGRVWIEGGDRSHPARRDPALINALRRAHAMLEEAPDGMPTLSAGRDSHYLGKIIKLAFLAPSLQEAILDGRQPADLTLDRIIKSPPPLLWGDQIAAY